MTDDPSCPVQYVEVVTYGHVKLLRMDAGPAWSCPNCGTHTRPDERPNGTFCFNCKIKLTTCCEGAALPERTD